MINIKAKKIIHWYNIGYGIWTAGVESYTTPIYVRNSPHNLKGSQEIANGLYLEHLTEKEMTRKNNPHRIRGRRMRRRKRQRDD